jgi:uncharacterized membrane protein
MTQGLASSMLVVHIVAGSLGLLSGYVALYASKGATLHRKSGMAFVYVMLMMATTGLLISAAEGVAPAINIPTALLTFYLVITSLTTVRPLPDRARWIDTAVMVMGAALGAGCFVLGIAAAARGGREAGVAYPLFLFGGVAVAAFVGDRRVRRAGGISGAPRLKRHLWRMCVALGLAAMAFFLGQADVFPAPIRIRPLLALPLLAVLATMCAWLWRLRDRRLTSPRSRLGVHTRVEDALTFNQKEQTS